MGYGPLIHFKGPSSFWSRIIPDLSVTIERMYVINYRKKIVDYKITYVGHPISSDDGPISQKVLLKSEFYCPLPVAVGVAHSCLKYGVFIIT